MRPYNRFYDSFICIACLSFCRPASFSSERPNFAVCSIASMPFCKMHCATYLGVGQAAVFLCRFDLIANAHSAWLELWGLWGDFGVPGTTSGWIVEHVDRIRIKKQKPENDNFCEQTICWARIWKNMKKVQVFICVLWICRLACSAVTHSIKHDGNAQVS